jgi:rhomboid protease GluP
VKQPKDENYWDMLQINLCPRFQVFSFTFLLTIINLVVFITTFSMSTSDLDNDSFMGMSAKKLSSFGAKDPYRIRYDYHVFRWVTPIFLHANFMHIFFNTVSLFWIGFMVEHQIKRIPFIILYMCSGIGAFIFSSLVNDDISVGASGAIFGLIGILIANLILNWRALWQSGAFCSTIMVIIMLTLISLTGGDNTDTYGHFGGVFYGISIGMLILRYNGGASNIFRKFSLGGWITVAICAICYISMITLFFTIRKPNQQV